MRDAIAPRVRVVGCGIDVRDWKARGEFVLLAYLFLDAGLLTVDCGVVSNATMRLIVSVKLDGGLSRWR